MVLSSEKSKYGRGSLLFYELVTISEKGEDSQLTYDYPQISDCGSYSYATTQW